MYSGDSVLYPHSRNKQGHGYRELTLPVLGGLSVIGDENFRGCV